MLADVIVNGGNVLFSIILAFGIPGTGFDGLGFKGIALGTVVAQYSGLIFASSRVALKFRNIIGGLRTADLKAAFTGSKISRFFSVNRDLFIRSVCLIIVYLAFTSISARFGDVLLASCSIMLKLLLMFSYFTDGFAFAGEALTGKYVGMRDTSGRQDSEIHIRLEHGARRRLHRNLCRGRNPASPPDDIRLLCTARPPRHSFHGCWSLLWSAAPPSPGTASTPEPPQPRP